MADYIDRTQALGYPLSFDHYDKQNGNKHFINGVESYGEYIEGLPSVDAVEVVRCRDCKHCEERQTANGNKFDYCKKVKSSVLEHFYCIWGEKE